MKFRSIASLHSFEEFISYIASLDVPLPYEQEVIFRDASPYARPYCSTAPRHGLASGCYLLDTFYKQRPEAKHFD